MEIWNMRRAIFIIKQNRKSCSHFCKLNDLNKVVSQTFIKARNKGRCRSIKQNVTPEEVTQIYSD